LGQCLEKGQERLLFLWYAFNKHMKSTLALNPLVHKLQHSNMNRGKLYSSLFQINEITTWPNGVENNMSDRPSATLTLDLLHPGCCYTMGIYCNICLSGLNMSDCFEVSCQKGFLWPTPALCDFDLLPREPQSWSRQALPRALFVPTGIKIGSFSNYHVHKFGKRQTNGRMHGQQRQCPTCQFGLVET